MMCKESLCFSLSPVPCGLMKFSRLWRTWTGWQQSKLLLYRSCVRQRSVWWCTEADTLLEVQGCGCSSPGGRKWGRRKIIQSQTVGPRPKPGLFSITFSLPQVQTQKILSWIDRKALAWLFINYSKRVLLCVVYSKRVGGWWVTWK